jgi:hypothetical protein
MTEQADSNPFECGKRVKPYLGLLETDTLTDL